VPGARRRRRYPLQPHHPSCRQWLLVGEQSPSSCRPLGTISRRAIESGRPRNAAPSRRLPRELRPHKSSQRTLLPFGARRTGGSRATSWGDSSWQRVDTPPSPQPCGLRYSPLGRENGAGTTLLSSGQQVADYVDRLVAVLPGREKPGYAGDIVSGSHQRLLPLAAPDLSKTDVGGEGVA